MERFQPSLTTQDFKVENNDTNIKNDEHIFWDGGFRSNTPLREVIQVHRDYWHKEGIGDENDVPDLEVYIVDLWPSELKEIRFPLITTL